MTLQKFIDKYLNKQVEYHSYNPNAKYQCVDLANLYIKEVWGLEPIIGTNAKDFPEKLKPGMEFVKNTPEYIPKPGEIAVWNGRVGGGAGHIAIVTSGGVNSFSSLDQNWSKPLWVTRETHTYTNVRGFIRNTQQKDDMSDDQKQKEIEALKTEIAQLNNKLEQYKKQRDDARNDKKNLQLKINELQAKVQGSETRADELQAEIERLTRSISGKDGEITKKQKQIEELEATIAEMKQEKAKDPAGEGTKQAFRVLLTQLVGGAIAYLYSQFPVLGQIGIEQAVIVTQVVSLALITIDKALHIKGKNIGDEMLVKGLTRF